VYMLNSSARESCVTRTFLRATSLEAERFVKVFTKDCIARGAVYGFDAISVTTNFSSAKGYKK